MNCEFLEGYDIYGSEAYYVGEKSIEELLAIAKYNTYVVAFNTLGYFKNDAIDIVHRPYQYRGKVGGLFIIKDRIEAPQDFDTTLLTVYTFDELIKIRLGEHSDGGYVICNNPIPYDLLIGCGIDDRCKFEEDFSQMYPEVPVHCYDGTIRRMPDNKIMNLTFHNINIGPDETSTTTNLSELIGTHNNVFLKMDIEGHEFKFFNQMSDEIMDRIAQIVIEIHGVCNSSFGCEYETKVKVYEKLSRHFVIIHAHANNNSFRSRVKETIIPNVMELTFLNKRHISSPLKLNTEPLPSNLDYRCSNINRDYSLNYKPFVNN